MNNRRGHVWGYKSLLQGVDSQCRRHLRIHGITDDPIGEDILDGTEVELAFAGRVLGVGVGPGRPASLSTGGFPRPALRTGRATLTASGSPRVHAAGAGDPDSMLVHGVGIRVPRKR